MGRTKANDPASVASVASVAVALSEEEMVSQAASAMGRKGGQVRVPKGFATMDPEKFKEIGELAAAARTKQAAKVAKAKRAKGKRAKKAA